MQIDVRIESLALAETFTIARGSSDVEDVAVIALQHDGITAYGEGAAVDYHGQTAAAIAAELDAHASAVIGDDPYAHEAITQRMRSLGLSSGARMAIDGALYDLLGKRARMPVHRLLGLSGVTPPTSFTIGISSIDDTVRKVRAATDYEVLKIKVGGPGDLERLEAVRANTTGRIRIDGNEGWTIEVARDLMPELRRLDVEFVEQPFPEHDLDSFRALREVRDRIPVIVDEGCQDLTSVAEVATYADGINIKLSKCGGIREALRMVHAARALDLSVMLGCMIESELGIAAGAHIAPLVDYVDLDGHLLISNSPFRGLGLVDGRLTLSADPGLGVVPV